jgi:T-complex protein 1 subunit theta
MQEAEVGDGTNLVVVLAGELLVLAEELLKNGLHCSEVIAGFNMARNKALEELDKCVSYSAPAGVLKDSAELAKCLKHVIAAKQFGNEELFASKIAEV